MCADNRNDESQEGEENPFDQEEILPSAPEGGTEADGEPAAYMPEDAVIEYGDEKDNKGYYEAVSDYLWSQSKKEESKRKTSGGFYDPISSGKDAALDYLYGDSGEAQEESASVSEDAGDDEWRGQLDRMFPENEQGAVGVDVTEPYPSVPGEEVPGEEVPAAITGSDQVVKEKAADISPEYEVAAPPARKKGPSQEVAELLERTSKRKKPAQESGKRGRKGIAILIVFLIAFVAAAVFGFLDAKNLRETLKNTEARYKLERALLEASFNKEKGKLNSQKQELQEKLNQAIEAKESIQAQYKADIEPAREKIEQLSTQVEQLQVECADAKKLRKDIKEKTEQVASLNASLQKLRNDFNNLSKDMMLRGVQLTDLEREVGEKDSLIERLEEELEKATRGEPGIISHAEVARLRAMVESRTNHINRLEGQLKRLHDIITLIQQGEKPNVRKMTRDLWQKGKEIIELEKKLEDEQIARRLYGSPQSTIVEWTEAIASGELDRAIKFYASNNVHRRRFYAGGLEREAVAQEFKEFGKFRIEPEVLLITIHADKQEATAKVNIRLTAGGKTVSVPTTMQLIHEYNMWTILEEGF